MRSIAIFASLLLCFALLGVMLIGPVASQDTTEKGGSKRPGKGTTSIEEVVKGGKAVISGDDNAVVAAVLDAFKAGRAATFYVTPAQYEKVMGWYWTADRVKATGIEPISDDEKQRIRNELKLDVNGHSNRIKCRCGATYGAFEFFQQGLEQHGRERIMATLMLKDACVIRVHPPTTAVCRECNQAILGGHYYEHGQYGCCRD